MKKEQEINEKFHFPDQDNIEFLIDGIINMIREDLISKLLEYKESEYKKVPDSIQIGAFFEKDINRCDWLGTDNLFSYHIFFDGKSGSDISSFDSYKDCGYTVKSDPERKVNDSIHGCIISVVMHINPYKCVFDKTYRESILNDIRHKFAHELQHAYQEAKTHSRLPLDVSDIEMDRLSFRNYKDCYDQVCDLLRVTRDMAEILLMSILYKCNYTERNAHVTGFYEKLLGDVSLFHKVLPIENYYEYKSYLNDLDNLKYLDETIFDKHKDLVIGLFGNRATTLNRFKKIVTPKIKDVLHKLKSVYTFVSDNIEICRKFNIKESFKVYSVNKIEKNRILAESIQSNEELVKLTYFNYYKLSDLDQLIIGVSSLFLGKLWPSVD